MPAYQKRIEEQQDFYEYQSIQKLFDVLRLLKFTNEKKAYFKKQIGSFEKQIIHWLLVQETRMRR